MEIKVDLEKSWAFKYDELNAEIEDQLAFKRGMLLEDLIVLGSTGGLNSENLQKLAEISQTERGLIDAIAQNVRIKVPEARSEEKAAEEVKKDAETIDTVEATDSPIIDALK